MNSVVLVGRLTKDPEIKYRGENGMAVASFTLAVDRPARQGEEKKADFPRVAAFGKTAENCGKFLAKGLRVAVQGRVQTGSYKDRDGKTVYTTDVVADRVEFLEWGDRSGRTGAQAGRQNPDGVPEGFHAVSDEEIPF